MKTQELLELAALDALGLLDEAERDAFDRAFRAAPPALQAQIRREQTRIAGDDSLLPKIEAPMGLKARVLAAWRDAVEAVADRSPGRRLAGALSFLPSRGVSPLWRAGAVGCAAACVVLAVMMFNIEGEFKTYTSVENQAARDAELIKEFGARFQRLYSSPTTKFVQFDPSNSNVKAQALLMVDPETNIGHFYARQLPPSAGGYALVSLDETGQPVRDENGNLQTLCVIPSAGTESGSGYNERVKIEPGALVGLVKADDRESEMTLLLRGRAL